MNKGHFQKLLSRFFPLRGFYILFMVHWSLSAYLTENIDLFSKSSFFTVSAKKSAFWQTYKQRVALYDGGNFNYVAAL